ncbi:hypothetical protein BT69DRAFT_1338195 [Atractiella rhizophila]|nr:hypothetical protein BT69DRAFT_1338195 [Atractiella rhizophila]
MSSLTVQLNSIINAESQYISYLVALICHQNKIRYFITGGTAMVLNGLTRKTNDADAQLELQAAAELATHFQALDFKTLPPQVSEIETKFHAYKKLGKKGPVKERLGITKFIQTLPKRKDTLLIDTSVVQQLRLDAQEFSNNLQQLPNFLPHEPLTFDLRLQAALFANFVGRVELAEVPVFFAKPPLLLLQKVVSAPKRRSRNTETSPHLVVVRRAAKEMKDIEDVIRLAERMSSLGENLLELRRCIDDYSGQVDWQKVFDDFARTFKQAYGGQLKESQKQEWAIFQSIFGMTSENGLL